MRRCRLLTLLLATLALTACVHQPRPVAVAKPVEKSELDALAYGRRAPDCRPPCVAAAPVVAVPAFAPVEQHSYALDTGDKLRIVVFGQDALSNTYTVDAAGSLTMPLIGVVAARGLTTRGLSAAIAAKLKQSFIRDPYVAVEVDTYRPFFVLGEVTYPGQYPYVPQMTVEKAVAIAGGFTPRAFKDRVSVTRKFHGVPTRIKLPMQSAVQPGDAITVGERWF